MTPRDTLAAFAFGYLLAWAMPLAAWMRARAAARRGDVGASEYFSEMAAQTAMGMLTATPLVAGMAMLALLTR